jgi:maltose/moltooligosaccharide transporter
MASQVWKKEALFFYRSCILQHQFVLYPFSSSLWMAAGLLWILDAANNTAMEPYRALDSRQASTGSICQRFSYPKLLHRIGNYFGQSFAFRFPKVYTGTAGSLPVWVYASFFLGTICSITSVGWSIYKTPEIPPTDQELAKIRAENEG